MTTGTRTTTRSPTRLHSTIEVKLREFSRLDEFNRGELSLVDVWRPESQEMDEGDFDAIFMDNDGLVRLAKEHDPSAPIREETTLIKAPRWKAMKDGKELQVSMLANKGLLRKQIG